MILWTFSFLSVFIFLKLSYPELNVVQHSLSFGKNHRSLQKVIEVFRELEETLMAGIVPGGDRWVSLKNLVQPWGTLAHESLQHLRSAGGSLLPTLKRLRQLAENHTQSIEKARTQASQAFAQCFVCTILVPLLSGALYYLLPGIETNSKSWWLASSIALLFSLVGALWLLQMAENARWGGLSKSRRNWTLHAECTGERFLALLRVGSPPDLAWSKSCEALLLESPELVQQWGDSIWKENSGAPLPKKTRNLTQPRAEQIVLDTGIAIKKAVQISLMEGKPCTERTEAALQSLRQNMNCQIERELSLLATRALKPLFFCVAPALLSLLFFGLWLSSQDVVLSSLDAF